MEHSNLSSKEQLPVDYSIGKFLLVYASVWSKLLQNIKCSACGEQELSVEFSDTIGHFKNNIEVYVLKLGGWKELFKLSYRSKAHCSYLVNQ